MTAEKQGKNTEHLRTLNFPRNEHPVVLKEKSTTRMMMPNSFTILLTLISPGQCISRPHVNVVCCAVCCEAIARQVNFLIDEGVLTGKGANSTILYMHYSFKRQPLGETFPQIHADNCEGGGGGKIKTILCRV